MVQETCWTLIRSAATGDAAAREGFARRYLPVVRAYLSARWSGPALRSEVEDAVQEVFVRCFKDGGPLERVDDDHANGFRPYLLGVCRHVAQEVETRRARKLDREADTSRELDELSGREERLTLVFDRAFAVQMMREARELLAARAEAGGEDARRRLELLRLRFEEGLPIRRIAELWDEEAARLHHEYARARSEFKQSLLAVVAFHRPAASDAEIEASAGSLLDALQ